MLTDPPFPLLEVFEALCPIILKLEALPFEAIWGRFIVKSLSSPISIVSSLFNAIRDFKTPVLSAVKNDNFPPINPLVLSCTRPTILLTEARLLLLKPSNFIVPTASPFCDGVGIPVGSVSFLSRDNTIVAPILPAFEDATLAKNTSSNRDSIATAAGGWK